MKKLVYCLVLVIAFNACEDDDDFSSIGGEQSPMGEVGNVVTSPTTVAGVSSFSAEVVALENGVSTYSGSATVTNPTIKSILSNAPECTVEGNLVTGTGIKFKNTKNGIEAVSGGLDPGVIVKYDAAVGDKYPIDNTGKSREVVSRSSEDDYQYAFFNIKVIKVEENTNKLGVRKITYWANHRFGLVGIQFEFDDGTNAKFTVYNSAEND